MGTEDEEQLTLGNRFLAASGAAVVAATVVNPLDVIKTRIQAQAMAAAPAPGAAAASAADPSALVHTLYERWGICETPLCVRRTPKGLACASAAEAAAAAAAPAGARAAAAGAAAAAGGGGGGAGAVVLDESIWHAMRGIARTEGLSAMWRGTTASLLVSVPMVGIYMPLYDHLVDAWAPHTGAAAAPLTAGAAARTLACFAVAPFELLRTRLQAAPAGSAPNCGRGGGRGAALALLAPAGDGSLGGALRRVPQLWTGLTATLLRDVPFSALYWALVEPLRSALLPRREHLHLPGAPSAAAAPAGSEAPGAHFHHTQSEILFANLASGFIAGGLAAAATTPFDVVKTRMQVAAAPAAAAPAPAPAAAAVAACGSCGAPVAAPPPPPFAARAARRGVAAEMRAVYEAEGVRGLFAGVRPRAYRAAPACAIVIACYELLKSALTPG